MTRDDLIKENDKIEKEQIEKFSSFFRWTFSKRQDQLIKLWIPLVTPLFLLFISFFKIRDGNFDIDISLFSYAMCFQLSILFSLNNYLKRIKYEKKNHVLLKEDLLIRPGNKKSSLFEEKKNTYLYILESDLSFKNFKVCVFEEEGKIFKVVENMSQNEVLEFFKFPVPDYEREKILNNITNKV